MPPSTKRERTSILKASFCIFEKPRSSHNTFNERFIDTPLREHRTQSIMRVMSKQTGGILRRRLRSELCLLDGISTRFVCARRVVSLLYTVSRTFIGYTKYFYRHYRFRTISRSVALSK